MQSFRWEGLQLERRDMPSAITELVAERASSSLVAASTSLTSANSTAASPSIANILRAERADAQLPAIAGGVILNGKLVEQAAVGLRERGRATKVGSGDEFHLGSNGKAMTSTLAAILVEKGVIRWNSTLAETFPELRAGMTPYYRSVTLEQLLNHRGGMGDPDNDVFERILAYRGSAAAGRMRFLPDVLATAPSNTEGRFRYSNTGYTVAAAMMERAAARSYESMMKTYIFNPLNMNSAGFGPPGDTLLADQPRGHDETGHSVGAGPDSDAPTVLNPAGLIHMSMTDWSKFLLVHLGKPVAGKRLLSDASLTKLHTADPHVINAEGHRYGFGWEHIPTPLGDVLWHNGSNGFWYSAAVLLPQINSSAFAVTNQGGDGATIAIEQLLERLEERILTAAFGGEAAQTKASAALSSSSKTAFHFAENQTLRGPVPIGHAHDLIFSDEMEMHAMQAAAPYKIAPDLLAEIVDEFWLSRRRNSNILAESC